MIQFRTLGTLALRDSTGEDLHSVLAQPKRVALLVYLAIDRPRGFHRRDTLLALLWPEQDEQHARWALNQALRHLRNALGREVVPSRGDEEVGVDFARLACDAVEFEAAIDGDDPARALELYQGDLLEGFHVSGCGEFERWLEEERVWLRRRAARAAALLAKREEARGELVAAGHWARRAFALSPDDEGEARSLIELLGRVGDLVGAVQAYEEFARRLRQDFEVEPAPETRTLIDLLRSRRQAAGGNGPSVESPGGGSHAAVISPAAMPDPIPVGDFEVALGHRREIVSAAGIAALPQRHRWRVSLGLGSLLIAGGAYLWAVRPPRPATAPDAPPNSIAVFPFAYRGSPPFAYLGNGMVDLLSANLNGAGELRTVDPSAVLSVIRQAGAGDPGLKEVRKIAARLNAESFVVGDLVEAGSHLRISARLYRVAASDGTPVSASVQGAPAQLFQLVDGLTAQLIAGRSGGPSGSLNRLAALTTDSLAALKAYLDGERQFRIGKPDSGIQSLERAIQIDSSFALAHYRMATAVLWSSDRRPQAGEAVNRALRFAHRLSDRDRRLMEAFAVALHGRIPHAERLYRDIVSRYPDDLEANYQMGELIFHRRAILRRSWLDARPYFERVLSIDPRFQGALYHLSNIAARERRLEELDSLTRRVLLIAPEPNWGFRGQRAVAFGDTVELSRFMTAVRGFSDDIAQPVTGFVVFTTGNLEVGRRLWKMFTEPSRTRGVRVLAHLTLAKIEVMTGRWRAAKVELEAATALDPATTMEHRSLLALWPLLNVPRPELLALRTMLSRWKATAGPPNETGITGEHSRAHPYLKLYLLGLLSVRLGEEGTAWDYAAQLRRRADTSFAPTFIAGLGLTLRAEVARARGSPAEALEILDSIAFWTREDLELTGSSPFYAREYEQFLRAELLTSLGRQDEALGSYRAIADELFHSGAPAHLRLAEIYERRGEHQKAAAHYARFTELWKDCDPELRPMVEEATRRMTLLSK